MQISKLIRKYCLALLLTLFFSEYKSQSLGYILDRTTSIIPVPSQTDGYMPVILTASATLDFSSIPGPGVGTMTISVTGAVDGDAVIVGAKNAIWSLSGGDWEVFGYVSAANVVTIMMHNDAATPADPPSSDYKVYVIRKP